VKPPAVFKIIPWARLSRLGGWFCVSCAFRQTEEPK